jgi:homoserine acetyltransferase
MDDVFVLVARPRDIGLSLGERRAHGMHAGHDAFLLESAAQTPLIATFLQK